MAIEMTTPFQKHGDAATCRAWDHWETGNLLSSFGNSLYARLCYLCDLVASVVFTSLALVGVSFGIIEAALLLDVEDASLLQSSYLLLTEKIERICASTLGTISPDCGYYFHNQKATPIVLGTLITVLASYMIIKNPPHQFEWHGSTQYWS